MKIWIYLNGLQQGPYSLEQVKLLPVDADTPVWYDGLPQWTPAGQTPLLGPLFATAAPEPDGPACAPETPAEQAARAARTATQAAYAAQAAAQAAQAAQMATTPIPPRPSTYIVWSIILTILCCSPFALAGIITGAISSSRYNSEVDVDSHRVAAHHFGRMGRHCRTGDNAKRLRECARLTPAAAL